MARTRLSPAASDDLREIRSFSKTAFGAQVASDYLEGLRRVFRLLRDRPLAGFEEEAIGEGVRSFAYRSHRLYYVLDPQGVTIIRILHYARDVTGAFESGH